MKRTVLTVIAILTLAAMACAAAPAAAPAALDETDFWRLFSCYRTPLVAGKDQALEETKASDFICPGTPPPPADWTASDFDDSSWSRFRLASGRPVEVDYGFAAFGGFRPDLSRQCLRGKFLVEDPAAVRDVSLSVSYRGGVIIYVNGREVGRGHLPAAAKPANDLMAEAYPSDAFLKPDGALIRAQFKDPATFKDRVELHVRRLAPISIPSSALRKGVNIVAVETFRAPYFGKGLEAEGINSRTVWATAGLVSLRLTASAGLPANAAKPSGLQIWNLDRNDRVAPNLYGNPLEPLQPIRLVGARNGFFTGQLAVTSTEPIRGLKAEVTDLKGPGTIPLSAVMIRYGVPAAEGRMPNADGLEGQAPAEVAVFTTGGRAAAQVVATVRVARETAPGEYRGTLTVTAAQGKPVSVPLVLSVAAWTIPDPLNFRTFVAAYQSPITVSMQYQVPEWSEAHWKYLEKSFELLSQIGNKALHIPVVDRTQFGNDDGMVYWVRKPGGGFEYDFTVFDRYLALAKKHGGPQDYVVMHVWHAGGWSDRGTKQSNTVTVIKGRIGAETGPREHLQVPEFATPESKTFWTPLLVALKDRLVKAGMPNAMCLGILSDSTAPKAVFQMFDEIMPDIPWHRGCHTMNPSMKPYYLAGKAGKVSYHEHCYGMALANPNKPLPKLWDLRGCPGVAYFRGDFDNHSILRFRMMGERALLTNKQGVGRFGLDFWNAMPTPGKNNHKRNNNVYNRWPESTCSQREPTVYRLTTPGPDGAVPNLRFEALREGLQEAEALIYVSQAAAQQADRIGKDLTDRIQTLIMDRLNFCRTRMDTPAGDDLTQHTGWQELNSRLYAAAAEVAARTGGN